MSTPQPTALAIVAALLLNAGAVGSDATGPVPLNGSLAPGPGATGGVAGGEPCACDYRHDDGSGEIDLGVAGEDATTVAMANAFIAEAGCPTIDVIQVAWGATTPGSAVTLAIYNDPNNDGSPMDVAQGDRLAHVAGVTAGEGTDQLNEYPIGPVDVGGVGIFFVVALTEDSGTDKPLRLDQGASAGSSWFATAFTDPDDPFQTGGVGLVDTFGFPGNFMLRAAGRARGSCPADLDGSGGTDVDDLIAVILDWECAGGGCDGCVGDADGDGDTDVDDLISVVLAWGPCPLVNDACADAPYALGGSGLLAVDGIQCEPHATVFSTEEAALDGPAFGCGAGDGDVWFRFVASCDGSVVIDTDGSDIDTVLEVYSGGTCGGAVLVACDDDSGADGIDSRVLVENVLEGQEFLIRIGGEGGAGVLNICCAQEVPDNDFCAGAVAVFNGLTPFSNEEATTDGPAHPSCGWFCDQGQTHDDVWFTYVADCGGAPGQKGILTVSTCEDVGGSATYDTDLVIYDPSLVGGSVCDDLEGAILACNDDDIANPCGALEPFHSRLEVPVIQGQEYLLRVGGWGGGGEDFDVGTGELLIACVPADDDECVFASSITPGETSTIDTCSATADPLAPICGTQPPDEPGRWLVVTGTGHEMTVSLCNLDDGNFPDTRLMVYRGGTASGAAVDCSQLQCVDSEPNDNNPNCPFTEELTWCTAVGVQYLVLVHGQGVPGCGLIDVTLTEAGACSDPPGVLLGACCLPAGTCTDDVADVACLAMGGTPLADATCAGADCPCPSATMSLQQHLADYPIDDVVRCAPGESQADNWYYREFTADDGLPGTFAVCAVEIAIFRAEAAAGTGGTPITVCLYDVGIDALTFAGDGTTSTPSVGCASFVVTDAMSGTFQRVPVSGTTTTGVLTVEVLTPTGVDGPFMGNVLQLGDNACGESTPDPSSFVRAPFCGANVPLPIADLAGPSNLLWRVHGEP